MPEEVLVEYIKREGDGEFWIDVLVDRSPYMSAGPFETATERDLAYDDMQNMMREVGAKDVAEA